MPIVDILGHNQRVSFPDDMTPEQMREVLRRKFRAESMSFTPPSLEPQGATMEAYSPSLRERMSKGVSDALYNSGAISDRYRAQNVGDNLTSLAEFVPGVGDVVDADEFGRAAASGDIGGMAMAGLGVIPVVGDAAQKGLKNINDVAAFEGGWLHGSPTKEYIDSLSSGAERGWRSSGNAYGDGIYVTRTPATANEFAKDGQVLPLQIRGKLFAPGSDVLGDADASKLDDWMNTLDESSLASLNADIGTERKRVILPKKEAKDFFDTQKANWDYFGGLQRTKPMVKKEGDDFLVEYTDFNAKPTFKGKTKNEAINAILHIDGYSVGDAFRSAGYDGIRYQPDEAVIFDSNNVKSAFEP